LENPLKLASLLARPDSNMRINTSRMWWVGYVARNGKKRKPYGLLVENPERNSLDGLRVD
jgi:hypothetical protein